MRCCTSCRGIAWPMTTNGDDCAAFVEACDECAAAGCGFLDDEAAARALSRATGLPVRYAMSTDGCSTWPYVMPAHLTLWAWQEGAAADRLPYPIAPGAMWMGSERQLEPLLNSPLDTAQDPTRNGRVRWNTFTATPEVHR